MDPQVKYHSLEGYTLTFAEKMRGNSIWWVVLVGRYPRGHKFIFVSSIRGASGSVHFKQINKGDHNAKSL